MASLSTSKGKFKYTPKSLFLGIKQIDKTIALANLKDILDILSGAGVSTGPVFGTLLGIVRDGDFITWDEDIDMFVWKEQEDLFRDSLWTLKQNGFSLIRCERRGLYSVERDGEYIDFYVFDKETETIRTTGASFTFQKYFEDTSIIDFKGVSLTVPREVDQYLTLAYGNWRVPVKYADFNRSRLSVAWAKSVAFMKRCLPDGLYMYLLHRHHKEDYLRFLSRCESMGIDVNNP